MQGISLRAQGFYDLAIEAFDKAIELGQNPDTYNNRGLIYNQLRQYERAKQDYDKAIALDSGNAFAYKNRGDNHMALGQYRNAVSDYDKAVDLNSNFVVRVQENLELALRLGGLVDDPRFGV